MMTAVQSDAFDLRHPSSTTSAAMAQCHAAELALTELTKRIASHPLARNRFLAVECLLETLILDQSLDGVTRAIDEATQAIQGKAPNLADWAECFSPDGRAMYLDPVYFEFDDRKDWTDECQVVRIAAVITEIRKPEVRGWLLAAMIACVRRSIGSDHWIDEVEWFLRKGSSPTHWVGSSQDESADERDGSSNVVSIDSAH